jgi:hypothetical protein
LAVGSPASVQHHCRLVPQDVLERLPLHSNHRADELLLRPARFVWLAGFERGPDGTAPVLRTVAKKEHGDRPYP